MNLDGLKEMFSKAPTKWVKMSGVYPEVIEERHVKIVMPLKDLHFNHVGTAYAGSMFVIMEIACGTLFFATYGMDKYAPVVKRIEIDYLRPTKNDLVADVRISEEEANEKIRAIEENGKGDMRFTVSLSDSEGTEVAKAQITLFILPFTKDFMKR